MRGVRFAVALGFILGLGACGKSETEEPSDVEILDVSDPGRVTIHRLNRVEYDNTVRDLLQTELRPALDFPNDDHGHGFDNIADVLALSPLQIELYDRASTMLVADLFRDNPSQMLQLETMGLGVGSAYHGSKWALWEEGSLTLEVPVAEAGDYRLVVRAQSVSEDSETAKLGIAAGLSPSTSLTLTDNANEYTLETSTDSETLTIELTLENPSLGISISPRRAVIDFIEVEGPLSEQTPNLALDRYLTCELDYLDYQDCAREIVENFASQAWRRPLSAEELDELMLIVDLARDEGDRPRTGVKLAMRAVLNSPYFLFRVELDEMVDSTTPHLLNPYELASRLSYFLWSSMPDQALFDLATSGELLKNEVLETQVLRMLSDEKAQSLTDNFAGQWLYTRAVPSVEPDPNVFAIFDDELAWAMKTETELYFQHFLTENTPVDQLLTAKFSFLNQRLAEHYGIEGVEGSEFRKVDLSGSDRIGLLTQGSLLTVTSYPARTSPVQRGKWVLHQLMCDEPPPPPPGVEGLEEEVDSEASLRERLEQHRATPVCASCHVTMDQIGFALENFDAVGQWRTMDGRWEVDATGEFPDGSTFDGAAEMAAILAPKEDLKHCLAEHMMVYALGRGIEEYDEPHLNHLVEAYIERGSGFQDLIVSIVQSPSFKMRRGEDSTEETAQ